MIQMKLNELCKAVNGELIAGDKGEFKGVSIDSRKIDAGQLFFAIIGERLDGHQFVESAFENGGSGAIVERKVDLELKPGQFMVKVEDTTQALQELAHYYRNKFSDLKVVGITGSAGKTTTKDMTAAVLSQKYNTLKTKGNLNNYYGLPLTLFQLNSEHQVLVVEMGMSNLKEIELLATLAEPQIGIVTNVGYSHLENLKTIDNVAKAKQELVENLSGEKIAVLNGDDNRVVEMAELADKVYFYGEREDAEFRLVDFKEEGLQGSKMDFRAFGTRYSFQLPLPGEHNAYNALAAIAVGNILDMNFADIQQGLMSFEPSAMRMDIQHLDSDITILNDAYNANPDSMKASLKVLSRSEGRNIAVLGDMLELGEYAEESHREIGQFAAQLGIDQIIVKGEFKDIVADGAKQVGYTGDKVTTYQDNQGIIEKLNAIIQPGDTILIKGSRGMAMEGIVDAIAGKED